MNIGRASTGVGRAAIASINIAGARGCIDSSRGWGSIISACTRGYIDRRGWGYINRGRPDYHHSTGTCKKPCAGRQ
jgi:hypothetical protein